LVLAAGGLLLAGYGLYEGFGGRIYQAWHGRELDRELDSLPAVVPTGGARRKIMFAQGSAIGRLEIPRLGLSVVVLEGGDHGTLRLGVGRLPNSSLPGEAGNVVLAGHRDTFFRSLREIRPGDEISLRTPQGTFPYTVEWMRVVNPADTSVLMPTAAPALTLVTCYPFYYVGSAPQRFIVRALPAGTARLAAPVSHSDRPSPFAPLKAPVAQRTAARVTAPAEPPVVAEHSPAAVETPAPPQHASGIKRAFRKIAGVFSPHRDKLQ
jgi:sortase A